MLVAGGPASFAQSGSWLRGINLGGPAMEIGGREWESGESEHLSTNLRSFERQDVSLVPEPDAALARMLRCSVYDPAGKNRLVLRNLPDGLYSIVLYAWEDNDSTTYDVQISGQTVLRDNRSGSAGSWQRLGPWLARPVDGQIVLSSEGGHANWSGIEIWKGEYSGISAEDERFFEEKIRPLLAGTCAECHGSQTTEAGLRTDRLAFLSTGGDSGPALVHGDPDGSLIIDAVRRTEEMASPMPPDEPLSEGEIADLAEWVRRGAPWPFADRVHVIRDREAAASDHWSLQPVSAPPIPDGNGPSPVDRFIDRGLAQRGLTAAPAADRRTLIRRVTYDLLGLPPSPEEVEAFVSDPRSDAFPRLVDKLLARPEYGEKWGRHWMDLVRYADTAGDNSDFPIPEAALYRDYIIDCFRGDVPYDQFLLQQVAGDLLEAETALERDRNRIATGYLAISRRFGSLSENYPQHLTIEDTIDNLGRTVLGLTMSCSRCHDHKFDPLSQADYYALYGIFDSTRYPFPGIELEQQPRDFVSLETAGVHHQAGDLAYAVAEGQPHNVRLHVSGNPEKLGDEVQRGFIAVLGKAELDPESLQQSGRLPLARWLTSPDNPLTARVMVNRIWQYHFGRGLVSTPSDFGSRGSPPTHPELLDWLAARFIQSGWSVKAMHREMLLSDVYQRGSRAAEAQTAINHGIDPNNEFLWRFSRRRMTAEEIRDTLLEIAGELDHSLPAGLHPFPPKEQWKFTQHHPFDATYETQHRSVYMMTRRLKRHPFFAVFDGPDRNATTPVRTSATTTLQALFMINDPLLHEQATGVAERIASSASGDPERIEFAFRLLLGRPAEADEIQTVLRSLENLRTVADESQVWQATARALLRMNEFLYID